MFFCFFVFARSLGFSKIQLIQNSEITYDISKTQFYFSVHDSDSKDFRATIEKGNETHVLDDVKPWVVNKVDGDTVRFITTRSTLYLDILEVVPKTCSKTIISASLHDYLNLWSALDHPNDTFCIIFYQPGDSYRVSVDCESDEIDAICELWTDKAISTGNYIKCRANSTCESSLNDGFIVRTQSAGKYMNITTRIISMKGIMSTKHCGYRFAKGYNISSNETLNEMNVTSDYKCKMDSLQIGIALSLIAIMFFIIICGFLIYFLCRPNREAYESSSDHEKKSKKVRGGMFSMTTREFDSTPLMSDS